MICSTRVRNAASTAEVDSLVKSMYQEKYAGNLTDAEERQLRYAADRRRSALKAAPARARPNSLSKPSRLPPESQSHTLVLPNLTIRMYLAPSWIGGERRMFSYDEAKRQFRLRRTVWHHQLAKTRASAIAVRLAIAIYEGLNGDPNDKRFGQCFKSLSTLSIELGCRRASIVAALKSLESAGVLRIIHGGGRGNPNRYEPVIAHCASRDLEIPARADG
jgi:hypothetical protein